MRPKAGGGSDKRLRREEIAFWQIALFRNALGTLGTNSEETLKT